MANHCNNYVTLHGSEDNIKEVMNLINNQETTLWYAKFHEVLGTTPDPDNEDVYDMFGSKWFEPHTDVFELDGEDSYLSLFGESAWSPVVPFIHKLCKKFNLTAEGDYDEGGLNFGGFYEVDLNGNLTEKTYNFISYRYLSEGLEGIYHHLEIEDFYSNGSLTATEKIDMLKDAKDVMSEEDYKQILKEIKHEHNNSI